MSLTRRNFMARCLAGGGLLGCVAGSDETLLTPGPAEPWPEPLAQGPTFRHGVASGDPLPSGVVLWTRVSPSGAGGLEVQGEVEVEWRITKDAAGREIVQSGVARTDASKDYTVHVDVQRLASATTYYYQFRALGHGSPRGRTKTLPLGAVARMRLAVASCSNYPAGFFNAYALMARADVDLVLHLGDYLYEYENGRFGDGSALGRVPEPDREIMTRADYRQRHAQYKTDPDLQELHRQHPCITIWDDHEVVDDAFRDGARGHGARAGDYALRKAAGLGAYREWMPVRPTPDESLVYRSFACGDLLDLMVLDARYRGRDAVLERCDREGFEDPARQMLGLEQESWLEATLAASQDRGARWRLIGQQVILAPLIRSLDGCVHDPDMWDGYAASRRRLFDMLDRRGINHVVVMTGDAHSSWAIDVARDPFDAGAYDPVSGRGSRLVELVVPPVSSPGRGLDVAEVLASHPHVKFTEQTRQGYLLVDVTHQRVQAEWHFVDTVAERRASGKLGAALETRAGTSHLTSTRGGPTLGLTLGN